MQRLNAVLDLAALAIDVLVEVFWPGAQVGNDVALVIARLSALQAHDFSLDNHAALDIPSLRRIAALGIHMFGLSAVLRERTGAPHRRLGQRIEHAVTAHGDHILHTLGFEKLEY